MRTVSGVVLACIASATFNAAIALQALEARAVPNEFGLRISLIGKLVRRRRWLAGSALAVLAFLTQTAALLLAPLTVVQTADGAGLLLLLYLGSRHLGERVGRQELLAVASIVAGIVGLTIAAPRRAVAHVDASDVLLPVAAVALAALIPYLARRWRGSGSRLVMVGAGFAFALSAFATKLVADALARHAWAPLVLVLVLAIAGGMLGTLSEQSALQQRQATQVAPIIFVIELLVPVILAVTVVGEDWSTSRAWIALCLALVTIGVVVLGRTPTIAQLLAAGTANEEMTAGRR